MLSCCSFNELFNETNKTKQTLVQYMSHILGQVEHRSSKIMFQRYSRCPIIPGYNWVLVFGLFSVPSLHATLEILIRRESEAVVNDHDQEHGFPLRSAVWSALNLGRHAGRLTRVTFTTAASWELVGDERSIQMASLSAATKLPSRI